MAAYVTYVGQSQSIPMYIGKVNAETARLKVQLSKIISIQCDGDELDFACKVTDRIVNFRVFTFIGIQAKEIVANWR